jgi:hypothetical protein
VRGRPPVRLPALVRALGGQHAQHRSEDSGGRGRVREGGRSFLRRLSLRAAGGGGRWGTAAETGSSSSTSSTPATSVRVRPGRLCAPSVFHSKSGFMAFLYGRGQAT